MQTSRDRILTTHTGSLPRPPDCARCWSRDRGEPYDKAELARLTREAVAGIVRRQAEVGVDVINDGEMSKPGYSTYVADRLSGFAGQRTGQAAARHAGRIRILSPPMPRMTGDNAARRAVCVGRSRCATASRCARTSPICGPRWRR